MWARFGLVTALPIGLVLVVVDLSVPPQTESPISFLSGLSCLIVKQECSVVNPDCWRERRLEDEDDEDETDSLH